MNAMFSDRSGKATNLFFFFVKGKTSTLYAQSRHDVKPLKYLKLQKWMIHWSYRFVITKKSRSSNCRMTIKYHRDRTTLKTVVSNFRLVMRSDNLVWIESLTNMCIFKDIIKRVTWVIIRSWWSMMVYNVNTYAVVTKSTPVDTDSVNW